MQQSLKENPSSHYNRYLAFFLNPAILPGAMRQEVADQFLNPDLMLLDADRLLEDETIGRVQKQFESTGAKLARNGISGARRAPMPIFPDRMAMTDPRNNPNKRFGRLGNNASPYLYETTVREAVTTGSYLAGTWLKPLYAAMYKLGPTIQ